VFIKVLFVVLVLCTLALLGAVAAGYLRVRRQMRSSEKPQKDSLKKTPGK
jgi:uncharacterized protein YneF (UPF0154 family)